MEADFVVFLKVLRENFYKELEVSSISKEEEEELKRAFERSVSNSMAAMVQLLKDKQ